MASDDSYANFLDKANEDTGGASANKTGGAGGGGISSKTVDTDDVPDALTGVEAEYTSEADEPFEPVSLKWKGGELSEDSFAQLVGHKGKEITRLNTKDFDPRDQYKDVLQAVERAAGGSKPSIFRIQYGKTRTEYYVVAVDKREGRVVGLKAKAVES